MTRNFPWRRVSAGIIVFSLALAGLRTLAGAKDRSQSVDPNDVTSRLFQLLDDTHNGKLSDFCILADLYKDKTSSNPDAELQHVLRVDYDKDRSFGKLTIHVRTMDKLAPEQLKTYSPKQIYDFGDDDSEKFVKSEAGPLGRPGDMYLRATADHPVADTPVTDEARRAYETYVTQYIIPALQKKPASTN
ncbi:MAG TPA: hypothetical protein VKV95_01005 [Terriglobia bacterium]|nr:hypothetical protein [Terriglobia bacterium]